MEAKKGLPKISIIFFVFGGLLILLGLILPNIIFKTDKNGFDLEVNRNINYVEYKIDLYSEKQINVNEVYMMLDGKGIKLNYSDLKGGVYYFDVTLQGTEYLTKSNNGIKVTALTISGEKVEFGKLDGLLFDSTLKIMLTIVPIAFGVFFVFVALIVWFAIRHSAVVKNKFQKAIKQAGEATSAFVGSVAESVKEVSIKNSTKVCEYCGCSNNIELNKCEQCGAPLKRK